jgi:hypothetical protein
MLKNHALIQRDNILRLDTGRSVRIGKGKKEATAKQ